MNKKFTALLAILGGVLIFGIKMYSWVLSGSVALLSDALESIVNILASLMMFVSVWISEKPADEDHMYGHQKIENISCFMEGVLVVVAGVLIGRAAYTRFLNPGVLERLDFAVLVSLFATSLNGVISWGLMRTARETNSLALEGDAKHLLSDVFSSVGVAAGLFLGERLGLYILDPLMAMVIGLMVIRMGVDLLWKAGGGLMDEACVETELEIRRVLDRHTSRFVDYHGLKTRRSGDRVFAELHLSMDGGLSVKEAHDFTDHLEQDLRQEVPHVEVAIHVEPPKKKKKL